jgi:hypothetical protein
LGIVYEQAKAAVVLRCRAMKEPEKEYEKDVSHIYKDIRVFAR